MSLIKLPKAEEVNIIIPKQFDKEKFEKGFNHGLISNSLNKKEYLKASFRGGFRAAKLYIKRYYKNNNIAVLPNKAKFKFKLK